MNAVSSSAGKDCISAICEILALLRDESKIVNIWIPILSMNDHTSVILTRDLIFSISLHQGPRFCSVDLRSVRMERAFPFLTSHKISSGSVKIVHILALK